MLDREVLSSKPKAGAVCSGLGNQRGVAHSLALQLWDTCDSVSSLGFSETQVSLLQMVAPAFQGCFGMKQGCTLQGLSKFSISISCGWFWQKWDCVLKGPLETLRYHCEAEISSDNQGSKKSWRLLGERYISTY